VTSNFFIHETVVKNTFYNEENNAVLISGFLILLQVTVRWSRNRRSQFVASISNV
jgi:hypothetical protein